jgi:SLT domain-containing protein/phage-related protein
MSTVKELRAIFTGTMGGMRSTIRSVKKELQGIGTTTDKSIKKANDSLEDLDKSLKSLDDHLQQAGNKQGFEDLNKTLRKVRTELASTGKISEKNIGDLQKSVVKAKDHFTSLGDEGKAGLQNLETSISRVDDQLSQLSVDEVKDEIGDLNNELDDTNDKLGNVENSTRETDDSFDKLRNTVMDATIVVRAFKMSLVGLIPVAAPVLASLTTSAGGLASSFVAAGAGVTGFATVAIPNLTKIFEAYENINKAQDKFDQATTSKEKAKALVELKQAYAGLSNEQKKAVEALQTFTTFFDELRKEFEKPVLKAFTTGLLTLRNLLEMFKPIIDQSTAAINALLSSFDQSLQTKDLESFFGFLAMRAGPSLIAMGESVGYALRGIMNLMVLFSGEAVRMENGLVNMLKRFSEWTANLGDTQSFKDFIEFSNRNTPIFLEFLSNLWDYLKYITLFLAPIGETLLQLINHINDLLIELIKGLALMSNWEGFIPIVLGLASAFVTLRTAMMINAIIPWVVAMLNPLSRALILTQLMTKAQAFLNATMLTNPFVLITTLLVGLGVALFTAYKKSETFRNVVNQSFESVKNTAISAYDFISSISSKLWDKAIKSTDEFRDKVSKKVAEVGPAITSGLESAKSSVTGFFTNIAQSSGPLVSGFVKQLREGFSSLEGVLSLLAPTVTAVGLAMIGVTGPIGIIITAVVGFIGLLYRLSKTNENVRNTLSSVWTSIQSIFSSVLTALQPIFDVFIQSFSEMSKQLGPEFQKTGEIIAQSFVSLQPTIAQLGSAFGELFATFSQLIPELLPLFTMLLQGWMQISSTLYSSIFQIAVTILPMLLGAFNEIFPVILSTVQAILPMVIQLISSVIPIVLQLAQSVIPLILHAVKLVFPLVLGIIQAVLPIVISLIQTLLPIIIQLAMTLIPAILSAVQAVFPVIMTIIQAVIPIIVFLLKTVAFIVTTVLIPAIQFILKIVQFVFPIVLSIIQNAINIITNIIKLFTAILKGDWKAAWDAVKNILSAAFEILKSIFGKIFSSVAGFILDIWQNIVNGWNRAKDKTTEIFTNIKNKITSTFNEIVEGAKALPGKIGDGIKKMAGKALDGVTSLGNKLARGIGEIINGITGGVNWVLGKIGVDFEIPEWDVPQYAKGTGKKGHPGGLAILGDGGGEELFQTPDGKVGLSPATDTLMNLPKGTTVLPHKETKQWLSLGIPAYASGIGDFASGLWKGAKKAVGKAKDIALDVWSYIEDPTKLMNKAFGLFGVEVPDISGAFRKLAQGTMTLLKDKAIGFVKDKIPDFNFGGNISGNIRQWIAQAMAMTGVPGSWAGPLATIAQHESGGNPSAVNNWDINAQRGIPSMGLMQTIGPTFNAYKMSGFNDILNPVHNAIAAIRYIQSRYGNVFNVPGIRSMAQGGPYKGYFEGARVAVKQLAWIAEKGAEYIIPTDGSQRALDLWYQAGQEIGAFDTNESNVSTSNNPTSQPIQVNITPQPLIVEGRELSRVTWKYDKEFQDRDEKIKRTFKGR